MKAASVAASTLPGLAVGAGGGYLFAKGYGNRPLGIGVGAAVAAGTLAGAFVISHRNDASWDLGLGLPTMAAGGLVGGAALYMALKGQPGRLAKTMYWGLWALPIAGAVGAAAASEGATLTGVRNLKDERSQGSERRR
jgi:hypothetical protein